MRRLLRFDTVADPWQTSERVGNAPANSPKSHKSVGTYRIRL
jgi:hypothetical protein